MSSIRYAIFILTLLLVTCCSSPMYFSSTNGLTKINVIDRNGFSETISNKERLKEYGYTDFEKPQPYQKVLRLFEKDAEGNTPGCVTSYHENGELKQYLETKNNRAFGCYKEWYRTGQLKLVAKVIGGAADLNQSAEQTWLFDGICTAYTEKGDLEASFLYEKGVLEGTSVYYHKNGSIWKEVPYTQNEVNGTLSLYLKDGSVLQKTCYVNGCKHGPSLRYWEKGQLASEEHYQKGKLIDGVYKDTEGNTTSFVEKGQGFRTLFAKHSISEIQQIQRGVVEGKVAVYTPCGQLISSFHIKEGTKHGEEIEFFDIQEAKQEGFPKISICWYQGTIQGLVKTWYPNGMQESQKEMSHNQKNGLNTAWYSDGSLMMIEEYEKNKLIKGEYYRRGESIPTSEVFLGKGIATLFDPNGVFLKKVEYENGQPAEL